MLAVAGESLTTPSSAALPELREICILAMLRIFSGISHGAALAQAAALKFQIEHQEIEVHVVTWNPYRHGPRS